MKSIVSIGFALFFLVGSFLPRSNFYELEKIPTMISHYQKHKAKAGKDFSILDFALMHFNPGSTHEEPSHSTELPLHNGVTSSFFFTIPQMMEWKETSIENAIKHIKPFSIHYHFIYVSARFQPPKFA